MNGLEIHKALTSDRHTAALYVGTYAADTLPYYISQRPALLVVNNQKISQPGEHWVAIFLNHRSACYFDSYGRPPSVSHHIQFLKRNCLTWTYNGRVLQSIGSSVCGKYSVSFLFFAAHHVTMEDFVKTFFTSDTVKNDRVVQNIYNRLQRSKKNCHSLLLCTNQTCQPKKL